MAIAPHVAYRVVDEVSQCQHHRPLIGANKRELLRRVDLDADSAFQDPQLETPQSLIDELGGCHRLERVGLGHVGDPRVGEQIVDEAGEIVRFLYQQVSIRLVPLGRPMRITRERAGERADVRERRLELVRHR